MGKAFIAGVGMTKFEKPGARDWDYPDMAKQAVDTALTDAQVSYEQVEAAYAGYVFGDSACGQRALYPVGMTGIPVYNLNNNCASGSTALQLAVDAVRSGARDVVLAVGFEKMQRGSIQMMWTDRTAPVDRHLAAMARHYPPAPGVPLAVWIFGVARQAHSELYGTTPEQFAQVAVKNHLHSVNNPNAQFQQAYTLDEVLASPLVFDTLTKLQCSPTSEGGAAAVVMSERAVRQHGLQERAVEVLGQALTTDPPGTFESDPFDVIGAGMSRHAAQQVYEQSGLGPEDVDVIELHDCFSPNELLVYEYLGLCDPGKSGALISEGATTYGGDWVVNPSGGLISKGHPLGATGLAQCAELTWQLRGEAGARQVQDAKVGLQHNAGLGGACVVTMFGAPRG